jgi:hypothetical protein
MQHEMQNSDENIDRRQHLEDSSVDEKTILKWILNK